jgi:hypothetical protein
MITSVERLPVWQVDAHSPAIFGLGEPVVIATPMKTEEETASDKGNKIRCGLLHRNREPNQ